MSNPAMIALIGVNPGFAALATSGYGGSGYGYYKKPRDIEECNITGTQILGIIAFILLMVPPLTILFIKDLQETSKERVKQEVVMQTKCKERGGKIIHAHRTGYICVIDLDLPLK